MQIKPPGGFSRGRLMLGQPLPHITPDALLQELSRYWGPQGFKVYKSGLPGLDVAIKKSGWTGVAIKIKHEPGGTVLVYNAFSPSAFVRMLALGLIPLMILNATSWKPLLRLFEQYVQGSPFFGGSMQLPAAGHGQPGMAQQPAMQHGMQPGMAPQPGMAQQPAMPHGMQPGMAPQPAMQHGMQPAMAMQPAMQPAMAQQPPQYPCQQCQTILHWVGQYQRWFCPRCQQYK